MEKVVKNLFERYTRGEGKEKYIEKKVLKRDIYKRDPLPNCNADNNGLDWLYSATSDTEDFRFFTKNNTPSNTFDFIVKKMISSHV